jgi:hypothetical protein
MYPRSGIAIVTVYVILRVSHAEGAHMHQVISLLGVHVLSLSSRAICSEGASGLVSLGSFSWLEWSSDLVL